MKVIFLDMDGVLNNRSSMRKSFYHEKQPDGTLRMVGRVHPPENPPYYSVHPPCVLRLKRVVRETGAVIVVSSSWRYHSQWEEVIRHALEWGGFPDAPILGRTQRSNHGFRGDEVQAWLINWAARHNLAEPEKRVTSYVIVDDDTDFLDDQLPFFVQTSRVSGLKKTDANRMIKILNQGDKL